jgi:hypothetical protein
MKDQTPIPSPNLLRFVQDFDALADLLQATIERDRCSHEQRETVPAEVTEFTTEWQMASTVEEAYSG